MRNENRNGRSERKTSRRQNSGGSPLLTFADRQVVAPLRLPVPDLTVDLLAADQLVSLPAPEGQGTPDRHAGAAFHVEGAPARRQDRDAGHA